MSDDPLHDTLIVTADDPCLDGHFPGNALVPAVVILDAVIKSAQARCGVDVVGITRCKFLRPLRPEQACRIVFSQADRQRLRFVCSAAAGEVAQGTLALR